MTTASSSSSVTVTSCRSCSFPALAPILDLGRTPLANALRGPDALGSPQPAYPLRLVLCPNCSLVQIDETVSPEILFRDYVYFSSFSEGWLLHARALAERLIRERSLSSASLVVEIASNDGYLLKNFVSAGVPVLGVEPARNIARAATAAGIETLPEFFSADLARRLALDGRRADLIFANNVMAHVPDVNGLVSGVAELLRPAASS